MDKIQELINYMYGIIAAGCVLKAIVLLIQMLPEENKKEFKKKFFNVLEFFIIAESLAAIIDLLSLYIGEL